MKTDGRSRSTNFETLAISQVPHGRNSRHKDVVSQILKDVQRLPTGSAIRIPLRSRSERANLRSAVSRVTRQLGISLKTSSDQDFLYVWRNGGDSRRAAGS